MDITRICNGEISVVVAALGAEMQSIRTSDGASWLWNGDPAFWAGRSPVLFPIVGKAPDDRLRIDGQLYPMNQHGFARRSVWTLVESGAEMCRHELVASADTRSAYPFDFALVLEHRVVGRAVEVSVEVSNRDHRPMPYGIGFHPAFVWPLPGAEGAAHRVVLDEGGEPALLRLKGGLLDPQVLPSPFRAGELVLEHDLFEADAMIFPEGAGAGLRYEGGGRAIHFTWENLPNLALWSKAGAPFVCLEPWHGMAALAGGSGALEERPYTEVLGPGAVARYGFRAEMVG